MKRKARIQVEAEKRALLGVKRKAIETRTVEANSKTRHKMKRDQNMRPFSVEEMMLFDDLFYDD